jgi:lipopolysaccharide export system protein LptA
MRPLALAILLFFIASIAHAQGGTGTPVEIIFSERLYLENPDATTNIQRAAGKVQIRQGSTLFYCDSCIVNQATNIFEAFGRVHINDNDTVNVYADYLRYVGGTKMAYLNKNVRLTDGKATLTTNELQYDVSRKIGTYLNGGRVVNKKTVLTSEEGMYYTDVKDFYFHRNVKLRDPAYRLDTDSLLYNTQTQKARFLDETLIVDSSKRTIRTREGFYDVANRKAEFISRTHITDGSLKVSGDRIASDDSSGNIQIDGRGILIDTAQGVNILANRIFANKKSAAYLATQKPLMIIKQEKDSIYIAADTLFSARLTDLYKGNDSLLKVLNLQEKDSTNRYFEAYRHVRVFSDSMQSVSDSLYYTFKDSTFELYQNPVVWSRKSQITGDTIFLYTKNKKAHRVRVFLNSFMLNEVEPGVYNQIKSTRINGSFRDGKIDSVRARGEAESVYFIRDKDSAYTSVNQTKSDFIDALFDSGELYKVVFVRDLKGTVHPIKQKPPSAARLTGFIWLESRRPKTKYELFD